ncbi:MAG: hypothetical protein AB1757_17535 [Acidobacteriota bacterium]
MTLQRIFSTRFISTLFIVTILLMATGAAQAQNNGSGEWKKRIFERVASGVRPQPANEDTTIDETARVDASNKTGVTTVTKSNALIGAWDLTLTFSDNSQVKSTLSVFPGRTEGEGTIIHAAEASLLLPSPTTPEQGAWQYVGGQQFIASYFGFAVNETFEQPFGKIGFRQAITMDAGLESFTGRATFQVIDTTGQVLFSDNVTIRGVRQRAVAP